LHEGISDFGDNASAMTRMMNAVEHLMLAGFISQVFEAQPQALADIAFVWTGLLASSASQRSFPSAYRRSSTA
jgi:hypothetical protein